ncbi:mobilization protein [Shewanella sp. 202IG2-18]|uniref:MbeD/MobD family mobilization/exclusion protein n=1 Tax=Parashewanella hymeniacidonis TaxID=2807618 RepID=UPI00195FA1DE|nr:mobilization protein [Parashewanella hymeniacidonis]
MTELETHLLNALKRLENEFSKQQSALEQSQQALQEMFNHTLDQNNKLRWEVKCLSDQISKLSK